jgi:hypothetical protein
MWNTLQASAVPPAQMRACRGKRPAHDAEAEMLLIQAAMKCAWRVLSEASGAVGVLISLAATFAEAMGWKPPVGPNWMWIAIGAALLFVTACKIELELM